jgi:hypothetical protein
MRILLPGLMLIIIPAAAQAMNWEGKDDWMADIAPAVIYENAAPHAQLLPDPACPVKPQKKAEHNPYEQVPLARKNCPGDAPQQGPQR